MFITLTLSEADRTTQITIRLIHPTETISVQSQTYHFELQSLSGSSPQIVHESCTSGKTSNF